MIPFAVTVDRLKAAFDVSRRPCDAEAQNLLPHPKVDTPALQTRVHSRPQQRKQFGQNATPLLCRRTSIGEGRPLSDRRTRRIFKRILDQQSSTASRSWAAPQNTVSPPLLEADAYPAQYPRYSKLSPPDCAEKISPTGESTCLCPTSLIAFSIRFAPGLA